MNAPSQTTLGQLTFSPEQAANLSAVLLNAVRLIDVEYQSHKDCVFLGYVTGGLLETARTLSDQVEAYLKESSDTSQQEGGQP
jgi:hypothetical protein